MTKNFLVTEKVSFADLIIKYTIRDFLLGIAHTIPATPGLFIRMIGYKLFLKSCGKGLLIKEFTKIKFPERVSIGDHVGIGEYTLIDGDGGVTIGDLTRIASHVSIIAFNHRFSDKKIPVKLQGKETKGITIASDVWIGTGVRILDGVSIGTGAVIGAGSVVITDVPAYSVAVGVPARVVKSRN